MQIAERQPHKADSRLWWFMPVALVAAGVLVPVAYLFVRALAADPAEVAQLLFRPRTLVLLSNTFALSVSVWALASAIALPLAWLAVRAKTSYAGMLTLLGVLPLAIPGYVTAYALLGLFGDYGVLARTAGVMLPRPSGFVGATAALGFYTAPYLFLNLRAALLGLDPAQEEAARSLGLSPWATWRQVVLPQLRPAFLAGTLLVLLHVLGDFGVVSLMRFETLSYALYVQYTSAFDRTYASVIALVLMVLAALVLWGEARLLKGLRFARTASGTARPVPRTTLGRWTPIAVGFVALVALATVVAPLVTLSFWLVQAFDPAELPKLAEGAWNSVKAAAPAAVLAVALAFPLAWLGVRHDTATSRVAERMAYLGYATPPLAFALALIFFALGVLPFAYQTLGLLVVAFALHFLAEAIGPIRSALYQTPPRLEDAARALGRTRFGAFRAVTLPLAARGLWVGGAFVFLAAMKELPITFLLAPLGFDTLAMRVWSYTTEALFGAAAPFALAIVAIAAASVALLLRQERQA
ncbi:MAG: iron ABC transporter permease [Bacteroidota bacterium]